MIYYRREIRTEISKIVSDEAFKYIRGEEDFGLNALVDRGIFMKGVFHLYDLLMEKFADVEEKEEEKE